jgi:hypothetical protein
MNSKLKISVVFNKTNKQISFSLPKKKISKESLDDIIKNKYIKFKIVK